MFFLARYVNEHWYSPQRYRATLVVVRPCYGVPGGIPDVFRFVVDGVYYYIIVGVLLIVYGKILVIAWHHRTSIHQLQSVQQPSAVAASGDDSQQHGNDISNSSENQIRT